MTTVKVNDNFFAGHIEDQKITFNNALVDLTRKNPGGEVLPYVFMLYGTDGMGKNGLARRFEQIALEANPFKGHFKVLRLDWAQEHQKSSDLKKTDLIKREMIYDAVYKVLTRNELKHDVKCYQDAKKYSQESEQKFVSFFA
jgi:hypothetical protein